MWGYSPNTNKHIFINNDDFDLVHFIEDCYRNTENSRQLLFEFSGSWYIATIPNDINKMRFDGSFDYIVRDNMQGYNSANVTKDGGKWIAYGNNAKKGIKWKLLVSPIGSRFDVLVRSSYELDVNASEFKPYQIASGSDDLSDLVAPFIRMGDNVYKSSTMLGAYSWQGEDAKDDIIIGYHSYTHKAIDSNGNQTNEDVAVIETENLIGSGSNWRYVYQSKTYAYTGELPLSNFTMTSGEDSLNMVYIELIQLDKNIVMFDGGAQIVE